MEKHSFSRRVNPTIGAQGTFSKIFPFLILRFSTICSPFRPIRIIFLLTFLLSFFSQVSRKRKQKMKD